jgi:NAD(P)-dependent dehydrogenase (short-subunit alcohol dehydrogenase family)
MGKLDAKIALVTGGNNGIGLATAKRFVNEGSYVFITGRRNSELTTAVKEIGHNVTRVQGDVSNLGDLDRLSHKSSQKRAGSISFSRMRALQSMLVLARSVRSFMIRSSMSM